MKTALFLTLLLVLVSSILKSPAFALAGVIMLFPLEQLLQSSLQFFAVYSYAMNVLIASAVLAAVMRRVVSSDAEAMRLPQCYWLVFALYLYAGLSTQWSPDPNSALRIYLNELPYIAVFVLAFPFALQSQADLQSSFRMLLVLGVILCIAANYWVEWDVRRIVIDTGIGRTTGNPLEIARFCGELALIAFFAGLRDKHLLMKISAVAAIGISIILIVRSGTRGQLIAALLVMVFLGLRITRIRSLVTLSLVLAISVALVRVGLEEYWGETSRWSPERMGDAIAQRLGAVSVLLSSWAGSPWTLVFGLGNSASYDRSLLGIYPHNMAIEILCEEGILGALLFIAILFSTIRIILKNRARLRPEGMALSALFLYSAILSFKQGSMLGNYALFMYSILIQKVIGDEQHASTS